MSMLVPFEFKVDEPEFRRLLLKHFPEVAEEIEGDEGLVHVEMSSLERLANSCIKSGDLDYLKKIYEFVGDLGRHQKEVEPNIINAVHVSFLEGLNFANKNPIGNNIIEDLKAPSPLCCSKYITPANTTNNIEGKK